MLTLDISTTPSFLYRFSGKLVFSWTRGRTDPRAQDPGIPTAIVLLRILHDFTLQHQFCPIFCHGRTEGFREEAYEKTVTLS